MDNQPGINMSVSFAYLPSTLPQAPLRKLPGTEMTRNPTEPIVLVNPTQSVHSILLNPVMPSDKG